jgi:HPt (histidine-containing phosphotransfer) domain-containing protein
VQPTSVSGVTPLYDRNKVLENLDGDEELLKEIAGIFLAGYRQDVERMRTALTAGDATTLHRVAHTLKGSMGNFGAQAGIDAAAAIERKARDRQLSGIDSEFATFSALLEQLADALRHEVGTAKG